jgi:hypothetical protein
MDDTTFEIQLNKKELKYLKSILPRNFTLVEHKKRKPRSRRGSVHQIQVSTHPPPNPPQEIPRERRSRRPREKNDFWAGPRSGRATPKRMRSKSASRGNIWTDQCILILNNMSKDNRSAPFLYPVAQLYGDLPGYAEVIKTPMDFSTVRNRIKRGHYSNIE